MEQNKPEDKKDWLKNLIAIKKNDPEKSPEIIEPPKAIEQKPMTIPEQLKSLNEKIDIITKIDATKKKKKEFKMPGSVRSRLKKLAKNNEVMVALLQENRNVFPTIGKIDNGMLIIGDRVYNGSAEGVWFWNGKFPCMLIPEWDLNPLTPNRLKNKTHEDKSLAYPGVVIMRALESRERLEKLGARKFSPKMILIFFLVGAAVLYVLFGGAKFGGG